MRELIAGKYELLEEIGRSGAGSTYQARDTERDAIVTVTVRSEQVAGDAEQRASLGRRVEQARELRHEHIVPVLGLDGDANPPRVVEAVVEGVPLEQILRERRAFSPIDALRIVRQLADALAYAHARGVIHGALRPASVLLQETEPPRAMLAAFGAGLGSGPGAVPPAMLRYAAPERLKGEEIDARIDIFALGLVLFEMLEGRQFFADADDREVTELLCGGAAPLVPQFSRLLPPGVPALVARMIRRSPAKRQQTMAQVRSEIDAYVPRVASSAPAPRPSRPAAAAPVAKATAAAPVVRKRVTVKMPALDADETGLPTPEPIPAAPAVARASTPHRRPPAAGAALIVAVLLALGWPLVRSVRTAPAAPQRPASAGSATRLGEAAGDEPAAASERHNPARTEPSAPTTTPLPGAGAAQEPSIGTEPDASTAGTYAWHRDGTSAAEAPEPVANAAPAKLCPPPDVAPRIVGYQPRSRDPLGVTEGAAVDFRVRASDKDPGDLLSYAWFLDGRRVSQRPTWRYVPPLASVATTHVVEARVSDGAGQHAPQLTWHIQVAPRMTEVNVRDWLARLAGAWERKDVATLRIYGIVTTDTEAKALRKRLGQADVSRVSIANETIRTRGPYATVTFDRTELDARGRTISSRRESYELEKRADGFIGLRPPTMASR